MALSPEAGILVQRIMNAFILSIVGGVVLLLIIHALMEREMEPWLGFAAIAVVLGLSLVAVHMGDSWVSPAIVIGLIAACVAWRWGQAADADLRLARLISDDQRKYLDAIKRDPNNAAAHAFLAAIYEKQSLLEQAIAEYQIAAQLDRQDLKSRVRAQTLEQRMHVSAALAPRCPLCNTPMRADPRNCLQCGWTRTLRGALRDMREDGSLRRGIIYAAIYSVVAIIAGVALRVSFGMGLSLVTLGWGVGFVLLVYLAMWPARAPEW